MFAELIEFLVKNASMEAQLANDLYEKAMELNGFLDGEKGAWESAWETISESHDTMQQAFDTILSLFGG